MSSVASQCSGDSPTDRDVFTSLGFCGGVSLKSYNLLHVRLFTALIFLLSHVVPWWNLLCVAVSNLILSVSHKVHSADVP